MVLLPNLPVTPTTFEASSPMAPASINTARHFFSQIDKRTAAVAATGGLIMIYFVFTTITGVMATRLFWVHDMNDGLTGTGVMATGVTNHVLRDKT